VETTLDKTVPAWSAFVSASTPVPPTPQAFPSSEEPTLYVQPQPFPQSTQKQPAKSGEHAASAVDENDVSQAPTQILTAAQMMEYHARRWQHETQREQEGADTHDTPNKSLDSVNSQEQAQQALANAPTVYVQNLGNAPTVYAQNLGNEPTVYVQNVDNAPTVYAQNVDDATKLSSPDPANAPTIIAPIPEASAQPATEGTSVPQVPSDKQSEPEEEKLSATAKPGSEEPEQATLLAEEKSMEQNPQSANENDAAVSTDQQTDHTFPELSIGTTINNRYEVTQVVKSEANEHIYQVLDHKGYLHCWSCNSQENAEGDEYCANCGAQLSEVTYLMHEYPATAGSASPQEASVLPANLVDTIVENGHTYAIEQPQDEQNAFPAGVQLLAASASDAGNLRRADPNEDSTLVLFLQRIHESIASPAGIFLVADGLGGHSNGQYASRLAINVIAEHMVRDLLLSPLSAEKGQETAKQWDEDSLVELLQGAIENANTAICQVNQRDKTDMGCTLTGFMIAEDRAYIFNVGDSRTYILRDENIYQLTKDHSLVGQLVEGGLIEADDVYTHPQRSQIYRSMGDKVNIQIDLFKQQIHPGDILLSCSDGLWEMVRNPEITEILNAAPDPHTASTQLIDAANANGGEDNVSAVVVFVR
jgi:serine/threonine protein phosphatase PrpC